MEVKKYFLFLLILFCIIAPSFALDNETVDSMGFDYSSDCNNLTVSLQDTLLTSDIYYDSSAKFDGDGSFEKPFKNLNNDFGKNDVLHLANGEYSFDSSFKDLQDVSIIGEDCEKTIINGNNISIHTSNIVLKNLTIIGTNFNSNGNFEAYNVVFKDARGCSVGEFPSIYGGSIYSSYSYHVAYSIKLKNCSFIGNTAKYGGAIYLNNGLMEIEDCLFLNNSATQFGGAIASENNNNITIKRSKFINDYSLQDGGGAIYAFASNLWADGLYVSNCSSTFGASLTSLRCVININDGFFENNLAKYEGGAIYQMYGEANIINSKFLNNTARNGGALFLDNLTFVFLMDNEFSGNVALNYAGGAYLIANRFVDEENNNFTGNSASINNDVYNCLIINPILYDSNYTQFNTPSVNITSLPKYYSLVDDGYVTPVKDQEDSGNCWAYSIIAALESCILKASNISCDLSEGNVKNLMAMFSDYGWRKNVNRGGNDDMAIGYFASWLGPVLNEYDETDTKDMISPLLNNYMHVQNVIFIKRNDFLDNNAIKEAILKYGGVVTGMLYSSSYLSGSSYYYSGSSYTDHSVVIVGWDDTYSKYNFARTPPGNGAFIVRNSWGSEWGNDGYFYVSYYDTRLATVGEDSVSYTFVLNDTIKYERNYQYDIAGKTYYFITGKKNMWYQNIYTAEDDEYISAVSTYFDGKVDWELSVYVNNVLKATEHGTFTSGYYTINLGDLIPVSKGDTFKIVFKISADKFANVPISQAKYLNKLSYTKGVSFISFDGKNWQDLYDYDYSSFDEDYDSQVACIKAFTISYKLNSTISLNVVEKTSNSIKVNAVVCDQYGNPLNSGEVDFTIDGQVYPVKVKEGIANLNYTFNKDGTYIVDALFSCDNYFSSNCTSQYVMDAALSFDVKNITYGENIILNISLRDSSDNPLGDDLSLIVANKTYLVTNPNGEFVIPDLFDAGHYRIVLKSVNNDLINASSEFNVSKRSVDLILNVSKAYDTLIINVAFSEPLNESVVINVSDKIYNLKAIDGKVNLALNGCDYGDYEIDVLFENKNYNRITKHDSVHIDYHISQIHSKDMVASDNTEFVYSINLTTLANVPLANREITFDLNGTLYKARTDINGCAALTINLNSGNYGINITFDGDDDALKSSGYNQILVKNTIISYPSTIVTGTDFSAKLVGYDDKPLANVDVNLTFNGKTIWLRTNSEGVISYIVKQTPKTYNVIVSNPVTSEEKSINLKVIPRITSNKNMVIYAYSNSIFKVRVYGDNCAFAKGVKVTFKVNGKRYYRYGDKNGWASLKINLPPKRYSIVTECKGIKVTNKITVKSRLVAKNIKLNKNSKYLKVKVSVKKVNGRYLKGKITLKFKGKSYKSKVNKKGVAIFKIKGKVIKKLKVGKKYNYKAYYLKDSISKYIVLKR